MLVLLVAALLVGRWTRLPDSQVALLWPAAGIAVWWFLGRRSRGQWALDAVLMVVAVTAVNALSGVPLVVSAVFGLVNLVHAGIGAYGLHRLGVGSSASWTASSPARVLYASVGAGLVSGVLSAATAATMLDGALASTFLLVSVRNTTGTFLILMLAFTVVQPRRLRELVSGPRLLEWGAVVLTGTAIYLTLFGGQPGLPLAFTVLPLAVWVGSRHGLARTTTLTVALGTLAVWLTLQGYGAFGAVASETSRAVVVQAFLLVTLLTDTTLAAAQDERRRVSAALASAQRTLADSIDAALIGNGFVVAEGATVGRLLEPNPALRRLLRTDAPPPNPDGWGLPAGATSWLGYLQAEDRSAARDVLVELGTGARAEWTAELAHQLGDGSLVWAQVHLSALPSPPHGSGDRSPPVGGGDGRPRAVVAQFLDVTARKDVEAQLTHMALHDELTGLPNRVLLRDRIEQALAMAQRSRSQVALIYLDLDDFKSVNDSLGHDAGDQVLTVVAQRLRTTLRPADTVARVGGDEFVACCPDLDADSARDLAGRLVTAVAHPVLVDGESVPVQVSAGFAMSRSGDTAVALLQQSDAAMYSAKKSGRGRVASFTQELTAQANRHLRLAAELRDALAQEQFVVHYQPIVNIATGAVTACESLVRWQHPTRGLLAPSEWLDVVEQSDLMAGLGEWVLRRACRDMAGVAENARPIQVHINVSARQLAQAGILDEVRGALSEAGLPSHLVVLELTETHLLEIHRSLLSDFTELHRLGVDIAVDDFGTGFSSLSQLVELPVDLLKIDRSFVTAAGTDQRAVAVIRGILGMASALGLSVVAEGVETPAQAAMLQDLGCLTGQGYLWSPPLDLARFQALLLDEDRHQETPPPLQRQPVNSQREPPSAPDAGAPARS